MNYEFKGTQGPWELREALQDTFVRSGSRRVAEILSFKEREDAHLIAAAPELLQSCIELDQVLRPLILNPAHKDVMTRLQHAIHKALNIQ